MRGNHTLTFLLPLFKNKLKKSFLKKYRITTQIKKKGQETLLTSKDIHRLKVKTWKMTVCANAVQRNVSVVVLSSDKIDLRARKVIRDKDAHFAMIKG